MPAEMEVPRIRNAPANLLWPGQRNVAVVFNIAYEAWSPGQSSGVGPMGNPLPAGMFDPNADSYGRYGANAGIHRLMRMLERAGVRANVFASGILAERDPAQVKAVSEAGHEIVAHGYAQDLIPATLTPEADEDYIERTTELLTEVTGTRPKGWTSPRATAGVETRRRLAKHGYEWQGDALDADLPYVEELPDGDLLAIPLCTDFNDLSHSMRFGRTPQQFVENFEECLDALLKLRDDTVILDVLVHTHCYGRPAGAWAYGELARRCAERDDIWMTTRGQIAEHVRKHL